MRLRKRPESAVLEDRYHGLRADFERHEAEAGDLDRERDELEKQRALARHLGRGNLDRIENSLHKVAARLGDVSAARDELRHALTALACEISAKRRIEAIDAVTSAKDAEKKAAEEAAKAEAAYARARTRHEEATAAVTAAVQAQAEAEATAADVADAIKREAADPLAESQRARERGRRAVERQRRERISWAVGQGAGAVARLDPSERVEAEQLLAEREAENTPERRRERAIEHARRTGHALDWAGQQLVPPRG
jgi:colicin import membrane protein